MIKGLDIEMPVWLSKCRFGYRNAGLAIDFGYRNAGLAIEMPVWLSILAINFCYRTHTKCIYLLDKVF